MSQFKPVTFADYIQGENLSIQAVKKQADSAFLDIPFGPKILFSAYEHFLNAKMTAHDAQQTEANDKTNYQIPYGFMLEQLNMAIQYYIHVVSSCPKQSDTEALPKTLPLRERFPTASDFDTAFGIELSGINQNAGQKIINMNAKNARSNWIVVANAVISLIAGFTLPTLSYFFHIMPMGVAAGAAYGVAAGLGIFMLAAYYTKYTLNNRFAFLFDRYHYDLAKIAFPAAVKEAVPSIVAKMNSKLTPFDESQHDYIARDRDETVSYLTKSALLVRYGHLDPVWGSTYAGYKQHEQSTKAQTQEAAPKPHMMQYKRLR